MTKNYIVLGAGYGDEGKGRVTSALCGSVGDPIVVRFSGGHQAGHTVLYNDTRHVFSSFGAGSIQGVPTYWSRYCTFYPIGFLKERQILHKKGVYPTIYVSPAAPVTTPMEIALNRKQMAANNHGSCGLGVGATFAREEDTPMHLTVRDLYAPPSILRGKIESFRNIYLNKYKISVSEDEMYQFYNAIEIARDIIFMENESILHGKDCIFEGSQGILLDREHGVFPHVTRSYTTDKNAMEIIQRNGLSLPEIYLVSRVYHTRHGNGPLVNEDEYNMEYLTLNPNETNINNEAQGAFRYSVLDIPTLEFSESCLTEESERLIKNWVFTCVDQLKNEELKYTDEEDVWLQHYSVLPRLMGTDRCYFSDSDDNKSLKQVDSNKITV